MRRLTITAVYLLLWYREVIRDLLPQLFRKGVSLLGRVFYRIVFASRFNADAGTSPRDAVSSDALVAEEAPETEMEPAASSPGDVTRLVLKGIVYTSVFNPGDGRKNWNDIVCAFCCALSDHEDATLVLKFATADPSLAMESLRDNLRKLPPFKCRVVALSGFLDENAYCALMSASTYVVNSSLSEGQCLPLMEFLSTGTPAIAPRNTAMIDYIDEEVAFVVNSSRELCCWPHDLRYMYRAHRYRGDWQSLLDAISASYRVAKEQPDRYAAMSRSATERMRGYCSQEAVWEKFNSFVAQCFPPLSKAPVEDLNRPRDAMNIASGAPVEVGLGVGARRGCCQTNRTTDRKRK